MAKKQDLPGFYGKRKILFGAKTSPDKMRQTGKLFMDAERYDDALEFFQRAEADDLTREIAQVAMERGNVPLYMRAKKVLGERIDEQEWSRLAASAEKAGVHSSARVAHLKAGHEEEAARVAGIMPGPPGGEAAAQVPAEEPEPGEEEAGTAED